MNYFSQPKGARELKLNETAIEPRPEAPAAAKPAQEMLSTFGQGMLVTGNVVCTGALQIFGRVTGEIHAGKVVICEGAKVEGKIRAQDVVIQGEFLGTVHANSVKLQSTAKVDGEVFNKQLSIEQNALFEGVSRRLERPVEAAVRRSGERREAGAGRVRRAGSRAADVDPAGQPADPAVGSDYLTFSIARDLIRKPVPTFRDHALMNHGARARHDRARVPDHVAGQLVRGIDRLHRPAR